MEKQSVATRLAAAAAALALAAGCSATSPCVAREQMGKCERAEAVTGLEQEFPPRCVQWNMLFYSLHNVHLT